MTGKLLQMYIDGWSRQQDAEMNNFLFLPFLQLQTQISQLHADVKSKVAALQQEADAARRAKEELGTISRK